MVQLVYDPPLWYWIVGYILISFMSYVMLFSKFGKGMKIICLVLASLIVNQWLSGKFIFPWQ